MYEQMKEDSEGITFVDFGSPINFKLATFSHAAHANLADRISSGGAIYYFLLFNVIFQRKEWKMFSS